MLSTILFPCILASLAAAAAIGARHDHRAIESSLTCTAPILSSCASRVIDKACFSGNVTSAECTCNSDINVSVPLFKCFYDNCSAKDGQDLAGAYTVECALGPSNTTSGGTPTSTASSLDSFPSELLRGPAAAFSSDMPACGKRCISKDTVPSCTSSLDPACVCSASNIDQMGNVEKCIYDTCNTSDTAVSLFGIILDCQAGGLKPTQKTLPIEKLPFQFPIRGYASEMYKVQAATSSGVQTAISSDVQPTTSGGSQAVTSSDVQPTTSSAVQAATSKAATSSGVQPVTSTEVQAATESGTRPKSSDKPSSAQHAYGGSLGGIGAAVVLAVTLFL